MTDYTTEEITAPAYLDDPKVMAYLAGTDANTDRLVLEEDGQLWTYSRRSPEDLCRSPLLSMVTVAFPRYAAAVPWTPVAVSKPIAVPMAPPSIPRSPSARGKARGAMCPVALAASLPKTGAAGGLLADFVAGKADRRPRINVGVARVLCPQPRYADDSVYVVVVADHTLQGYAKLQRSDFALLDTSTLRPDTMMFKLIDGGITTRIRKSPGDFYVQAVDALIVELGGVGRISFERLQ
jgi:hypothetical protein